MKPSSLTPVVGSPIVALPPLLLTIIEAHLASLLLWFSQYVYGRLLARDGDHLLVQLAARLDVGPLEAACAGYHPHTGRGRPVTHTVARLLRALVVKYLYGYSLRELEFQIRHNLLIKWFVGYPVFAEGPDHATLARFELYCIRYHPRLFFDTVLAQIDDTLPEQRGQAQIGDTFALLANAARESLIQRLRHTSQQMLLALHVADPMAYEAVWRQLDQVALFGPAKEPLEYYLSREAWRQRLHTTVAAVWGCLALLDDHTLDPAVTTWVARLQKILADELAIQQNEQGEVLEVRLLPKKKRGSYPICSATDPEATIRNHGQGKEDFGYNASLLVNRDFIREIQVATGSQPDPVALPPLLQAQQEHHDLCPDKVIYDQIAGTGKTMAAVHEASDGRTQLVAKPMPYDKRTERFGPQDFTLSPDELSLTCPNGRRSVRKYRAGSGDGFTFRFMPAQCRSCPLLARCRGSEEVPTTPRNVFISDYYFFYLRALAYSQTEEFKADMKLRPHVERIIAALVLHNGARRARFRGLAKVDYQVKMCAMAYNLKRWLALLAGKGRPKAAPPSRRHYRIPAPRACPERSRRGEVGLVAA